MMFLKFIVLLVPFVFSTSQNTNSKQPINVLSSPCGTAECPFDVTENPPIYLDINLPSLQASGVNLPPLSQYCPSIFSTQTFTSYVSHEHDLKQVNQLKEAVLCTSENNMPNTLERIDPCFPQPCNKHSTCFRFQLPKYRKHIQYTNSTQVLNTSNRVELLTDFVCSSN